MKIKRRHEITWNDLPRIESPFFAHTSPMASGHGDSGQAPERPAGKPVSGEAFAAKPQQDKDKTKPKGKPAPKAYTDPTQDPRIKALIDKSPTLKADLAELKKQGWEVHYGPENKTALNHNVIYINRSERNDPVAALQSIAHEAGHAKYNETIDTSSKQAYVDGYLAGEGEATLGNIKVQREILANGGPDIGLAGDPANHAAYNAIYNKHNRGEIDAATARAAIGTIYRTGERTFGRTYGNFYGNHYDRYYGTP